MGIPIEKTFVVNAPPDRVWAFLTDPARVASCLPGAAITERVDDQTYVGTIAIKVGPVTANYRGTLRFDRLDAAAREAELSASGQETRGKGGADMRMKSRIVERAPGVSEVTVTSDVNVVGVLAQFGRGLIQDVSDQLFVKFTVAMRSALETAPSDPALMSPTSAAAGAAVGGSAPTAAASDVTLGSAATPAVDNVFDAGSLGAAAVRRATGRTLRRPALWIALIVLAFLISYWLSHRSHS
jgi:carbon monoxide dehydrogenase subunit G